MFSTIFIIVILATASQIEAANFEARVKENSIEDATQVLRKLNATIADLVKDAMERVIENEQSFKSSSGVLISTAVNTIRKDSDKAHKELAEIKEQAKARGADITECLVQAEADLNNLPIEYTSSIENLGARMLVVSEEIFSRSVDAIQDKFTAVSYYQQEISKCANESPDTCINDIIEKMNGAFKSIPSEIKSDVEKAEESSIALIGLMYPSIASTTTDYLTQSRDKIKQIATCAENK